AGFRLASRTWPWTGNTGLRPLLHEDARAARQTTAATLTQRATLTGLNKLPISTPPVPCAPAGVPKSPPTSPPAPVTRAHEGGMAVLAATKRTDPSASSMLAPPVWKE